jgi:hypothetical protein
MKINKDNFFIKTNGRFIECEIPSRPADYISKTPWGDVSSVYYYTNEGVIRVSDHWGGVASCQWNLNTVNTFRFDKCRKTELKAGYISFKELEENYNLGQDLLIAVSKNDKVKADEIREQLKNKF